MQFPNPPPDVIVLPRLDEDISADKSPSLKAIVFKAVVRTLALFLEWGKREGTNIKDKIKDYVAERTEG